MEIFLDEGRRNPQGKSDGLNEPNYEDINVENGKTTPFDNIKKGFLNDE